MGNSIKLARQLIFLATGTLFAASCGKPLQADKLMKESNEKISAPTAADQERLREQRLGVEKYLGDQDLSADYHTTTGKLRAIQALLDANTYNPTQSYELQCLGIVLGDAFVQEFSMEWVMIEDEYGRDPVVRAPGSTIILYPMTMISKRVEQGKKVDVFEMFSGVEAKVAEMKRQRM